MDGQATGQARREIAAGVDDYIRWLEQRPEGVSLLIQSATAADLLVLLQRVRRVLA